MADMKLPDREIVSQESFDNRSGDCAKLSPLPDDTNIRAGLVTDGNRVIINYKTRRPMWRAIALILLGRKRKGDEIYKQVLQEEMQDLGVEMAEKGLLGEHSLVSSRSIRERVSRSRGYIGGSVLSFAGSFEADSDHKSRVLFAWRSQADKIIFSQVDIENIEVVVDESIDKPTVAFEFNARKLIEQPLYAKGALVRYSFGHPNRYLEAALSRVTFKVNSKPGLQEYLLPVEKPVGKDLF